MAVVVINLLVVSFSTLAVSFSTVSTFLLLAYLPVVTIRAEARFLILRIKPQLFENDIFIFSQTVN